MHIFPFDKVAKGEQIIIYGAGIIGQEFVAEIEKLNYCSILALADKNAMNIKNSRYKVILPENINYYNYDKIVIALESEKNIVSVMNILMELNVPEEKIVSVSDSIIEEANCVPEVIKGVDDNVLHIAIKQSFGLGDAMMDIVFVNAIKRVLGVKCEIEYICKYGELYYGNILFDNVVNEQDSKRIYDILFESKHIAIVAYWDEEKVKRISDIFYKFCKHSIELQLKYMKRPVRMHELYSIAKLLKRNRIEEIDIYNDLMISRYDKPVFGVLENENDTLKKYELYGKKYIVVNRDVDADGSIDHPKLWSADSYEDTLKLIRCKFPEVMIVQLGAERKETLLRNIDMDLTGKTSLTELKVLLKNSIMLLSSEGGLVHIMHFLNGKSAVIFGPTDEEHFGYEGDFIFVNRTCGRPCVYIEDEWNKRCIARYEIRSCVDQVKAENVLEGIWDYIQSKL